jgi:hypothetical protein
MSFRPQETVEVPYDAATAAADSWVRHVSALWQKSSFEDDREASEQDVFEDAKLGDSGDLEMAAISKSKATDNSDQGATDNARRISHDATYWSPRPQEMVEVPYDAATAAADSWVRHVSALWQKSSFEDDREASEQDVFEDAELGDSGDLEMAVTSGSSKYEKANCGSDVDVSPSAVVGAMPGKGASDVANQIVPSKYSGPNSFERTTVVGPDRNSSMQYLKPTMASSDLEIALPHDDAEAAVPDSWVRHVGALWQKSSFEDDRDASEQEELDDFVFSELGIHPGGLEIETEVKGKDIDISSSNVPVTAIAISAPDAAKLRSQLEHNHKDSQIHYVNSIFSLRKADALHKHSLARKRVISNDLYWQTQQFSVSVIKIGMKIQAALGILVVCLGVAAAVKPYTLFDKELFQFIGIAVALYGFGMILLSYFAHASIIFHSRTSKNFDKFWRIFFNFFQENIMMLISQKVRSQNNDLKHFVQFNGLISLGFWTPIKIARLYVAFTLLFVVPTIVTISFYYSKIEDLHSTEDALSRGLNPRYSEVERMIAKRMNDLYFFIVDKCHGTNLHEFIQFFAKCWGLNIALL